VKSRIILTGMAAVTLISITACGGSTSGQAKPELGATIASPSSSSSTPHTATSSHGTDSSLKDTDPCTLLTPSEASKLGIPGDPKPEKIGVSQTCQWKPKDASLFIGTRTNDGLSTVLPNGGEIRDITVGKHPAKQLVDVSGSCGIVIGVTSSSRVEVVLNSGPRVDPCPFALQVAQLVEPKLP
jgi:hypothetical protein